MANGKIWRLLKGKTNFNLNHSRNETKFSELGDYNLKLLQIFEVFEGESGDEGFIEPLI